MNMRKINAKPSELADLYLEGKTLQEIGDIYGVSRERIRQILSKNGFSVRDAKSYYKLQESQKCKKLADKVMIKTANDSIKELNQKSRRAEHLLYMIKRSRYKLVNNFRDTLYALKEEIYMAESGKEPPSKVFRKMNEFIIEELGNLKNYVYKIEKGDFNEKDFTERQN